MKKLNDLMQAVMQGASLTGSEALELLEVAKLAAQFTEANDRGDDANQRLEDDGCADSGDTYDRLLDVATQADDDYNRTKDALFIACRDMMGWPAREPNYPPLDPTRGPHPFAQEGCF